MTPAPVPFNRPVSTPTKPSPPPAVAPAPPPQPPAPASPEQPTDASPEQSLPKPKPRLSALTICVDYSDYLALALPSWSGLFDRVLVVTHPADRATQLFCQQHDTPYVETDIFFANNTPFNKGGAINKGLAALQPLAADDWLAFVDSDIVFPPGYCLPVETFEPNRLYGAPRRMCRKYADWELYKATNSLARMPAYFGNKKNVSRIIGYLQIFRYGAFCGTYLRGKHPEGPTACRVDVEFADAFMAEYATPQTYCLPDVIHLGAHAVNWQGRVSERFG